MDLIAHMLKHIVMNIFKSNLEFTFTELCDFAFFTHESIVSKFLHPEAH